MVVCSFKIGIEWNLQRAPDAWRKFSGSRTDLLKKFPIYFLKTQIFYWFFSKTAPFIFLDLDHFIAKSEVKSMLSPHIGSISEKIAIEY